MDCCQLPVAISVAACAIANQIENANELALLAAVLTQLGDTLTTIAVQRDLCSEADTVFP